MFLFDGVDFDFDLVLNIKTDRFEDNVKPAEVA